MKLNTRVVTSDSGRSLVVEFRNPKNERWEIVASFSNDKTAYDAKQFYDSREYSGWSSLKLSKSNQ